MSYSYSIANVADVDQQWNTLPEHGRNHCVPASFINWMYYFARKGHLTALPFANGQSGSIWRNVSAMGDYMDTDGDSGTSQSDAIDGLLEWSDDRNLPYVVMNAHALNGDNVRYTNLRNLLQMGAHVVVKIGRYRLDGDEFERIGGHAMTLVGLTRTDSNVITVRAHDPNNDRTQRTTQSSLRLDVQTVTEKRRNIEGDEVTVLRWGPDSVDPPYQCIDGWTAIQPWFAVSNVVSGSITRYVVDISTGRVEDEKIDLPFSGDISELALDPSAPFASVIASATGQVWTVNLADKTWTKVAAAGRAQRLSYGGRRQRLFVVAGREVAAFADDGSRVGSLDVGVALEAMTWDATANRMIGLGEGKLLSLDPMALRLLGGTEAPDLDGDGRLSLSINRRTREIVVSRDGSPEITAARWANTSVTNGRRIHLRSDGASAGVHLNHKGRMFSTERGRIATFDADGRRVSGGVFDGLAAGPLLKVARSFNSLDVERSRRRGWRS